MATLLIKTVLNSACTETVCVAMVEITRWTRFCPQMMLLCDLDDFRMLLMEFTPVDKKWDLHRKIFSKHVREFIHALIVDPGCNSEIPEKFLFWGLVFHGRCVWEFTDASCKYEKLVFTGAHELIWYSPKSHNVSLILT